MITSRRFALATAAIVLGLSACGSANTASSSDSTAGTIATGGTTIADPATPHVIHLGAGRWAPSTAGGPMSAESADSKMMAVRNITYVFDGTFPTLSESAPSWQLPAGFTPDAARIAAMAAALGVEGTARKLPAEQGGGWMFGPEDYSTATFSVSVDSLGSWWFSPAPTVSATTDGCAYGQGDVIDTTVAVAEGDTLNTVAGLDSDAVSTEAAPANGEATPAVAIPPECIVDPSPPVGVPDEAAAMTSTKALLTSLGYDPGSYDYEFYGDEWSANVTAYLRLGGQRSQLSVSVGFGAEGAITWASGSLATPVQGDDYPLAGVQVGLDRLADQASQWMSYGGPGSVLRTESASAESSGEVAPADPVVAPADTTIIEPSTDVAATEPAVAPSDTVVAQPCGAAVDCAPIDAEPVTIHLTDVRLDSTMIWDEDGTTWLLPAYTFSDADGGTYSIIAVADEYLDVPAPVAVPLPDTLTPDTIIVDDAGTVETIPGDTGSGATGSGCTTPDMTPVDQAAVETALVGLDEDAANAAATVNGWTMRVTERDGQSLPATADFQPSRANVAVSAGVVTAVQSIG